MSPSRPILIFFATLESSNAASFDCSRATTETEATICSEYNLSVDDRIISYLYEKHLNWRKGIDAWWSGDGIEIPVQDIKEDQKMWLIDVRDRCQSNVACLEEVLSLRIDHFLKLVRLERPQSGTNHQIYFSPGNSKVALRLFSAIFENIDRHGMLPQFTVPQNSYFTLNLPHSSELSGHDLNTMEPIIDHFLDENSSKDAQLNFGKFIEIDYEGLTTCLKSKSLRDVKWSGNWVYLNSIGYNDCIEFHWDSGFFEHFNLHSGDPKEIMFFPLVQSNFVKIASDSILNTLNICSGISQLRFCEDRLFSELNQTRLRFASEFFEQNLNAISTGLNSNTDFLTRLDSCENIMCARSIFLESISEFDKLIKHAGEIPPYCGFGEDGIYRCGEAQVCMSGISVFQLKKKNDELYQLDFWAEHWNYDPWNGENTPTKSFDGESYLSGTYPCTHDVYSFDGISMSYGGCTSGDIEPEGTMFWLSCEGENELCGQENYVPCVAAR